MRSGRELWTLAKDLGRYLAGKDYFRTLQPLGPHWVDPRCYYNDVRAKADWPGVRVAGVPAMRIEPSHEDIVLPVMALLFGLGALDRFFLGETARLAEAESVAAWMLANVLPEGYFDNRIIDLSPGQNYYSNNSAMSQGLALSFGMRAVRYRVFGPALTDRLAALMPRLASNMISPVNRLGTGYRCDDGLVFLEYCNREHSAVYNGWVFAWFGLSDYVALTGDPEAALALGDSLAALKARTPAFQLPNGWCVYDDQGRICSPFYHHLQMALLEAMARLTQDEVFAVALKRAQAANSWNNRIRYAVDKIVQKAFRDKEALATQP